MALIHLTTENFKTQVLNSSNVVLADFYADWCGPCQMLAPVLDKIAEDYPQITVAKINTDKEQELALNFGIESIPTLLLFKGGKLVSKATGYRSEEQISQMLANT